MEVNLRKLYPTLYSSDVFVEVSDEVFEAIRAFERAEAAWQRRKYRYRAQYSLDYGNGIENDLLLWPETPEEAFEAKMMRREIFEALHALPAAQKLRVYARYFLEEKPRQIARRVRNIGGGLHYVKAMGIALEERNLAQVTMNLTDYTKSSIYSVFEMVKMEARRYGVRVVGSEVVGIVPMKALLDCAEYYLQIEDFSVEQVLEFHL